MPRKTRPYLFYDTTASVCTRCLRRVEAKILIKDARVFMDKWCPAHGMERVLVSDDADYYRSCREVYLKPPEMPERFNTPMHYGCPYDCGLCPDHMQHSCLALVEINEHCNLRCPVCYAQSGPERKQHHSLESVIRMLDAVVANEGEPDVVQISGGEPTLHPQFFDILDQAKRRPIRHLMINTNGVRIAQDAAFAQRLAGYAPGIEIYLQFDSLRDAPLRALRGADLTRVRTAALESLNRLGLSTTLVITVCRGINDRELGEIIDFALAQPCVRGVTFQPLQAAGRVELPAAASAPYTVSELRTAIAEQSRVFTREDIVPVPCNPDTLAMAYALKVDGQVQPLTRYLDARSLLAGPSSTIAFERDPALRDRLMHLFATNHSPESQAHSLSEVLCCLPRVAAPGQLRYDNVFRVLIVQFMDARSLDIRALKRSCIHIARPDGRLIPFEAYNIFYRDEQASGLAALRSALAPALTGHAGASPAPSGRG